MRENRESETEREPEIAEDEQLMRLIMQLRLPLTMGSEWTIAF